MEPTRKRRVLTVALALALTIAGGYSFVVILSGRAAASTSTDIGNLTTTITNLMVSLLPLVIMLLVIGFVFGMLSDMFTGFNAPRRR